MGLFGNERGVGPRWAGCVPVLLSSRFGQVLGLGWLVGGLGFEHGEDDVAESHWVLWRLRCVSLSCGVGCPGGHEFGSPFVIKVGSYVGLFDLVADGVAHRHLDDGCWGVGGFE